MKKLVRLTESGLHRIVKESVKRVIKEMQESNDNKYLWYSVKVGISDDFNTEEECINDAHMMNKKYPSEYGIYTYNASEFPDGNVDIDDCTYIGYVGDSRGYVFRRNKVRTRTLDHSIPQMLALSGEIKESEIRHHPDRNILLRVIGIDWEEPMYALLPRVPLSKCQAFLLCSDGFWELIEEKTMCELLKKAGSVEEWLDSMVRVVRENGAGTDMDNNSAVAVWL